MNIKIVLLAVLLVPAIGALVYWQSGKGWQDEQARLMYEQQGRSVDELLVTLKDHADRTPLPRQESLLELIALFQGYRDSHDIPAQTSEVEAVLLMKAIGPDPDQCPWIPDMNAVEYTLHRMQRIRRDAYVD